MEAVENLLSVRLLARALSVLLLLLLVYDQGLENWIRVSFAT